MNSTLGSVVPLAMFVLVFLLTLCLQFLYLCWNSLCVALLSLNSVTNSLRAVFIDLRSTKIWTNREKKRKMFKGKSPQTAPLSAATPLQSSSSTCEWLNWPMMSFADHNYCYHDYHHLHRDHDDNHYPDVDVDLFTFLVLDRFALQIVHCVAFLYLQEV